MTEVEVICDGCGRVVKKPASEVNRSQRLGRRLFCSRYCSGATVNESRRALRVQVQCPCGAWFSTTTAKKAARHCSRSCASRYSMTEERREAQRQAGATSTNLLPQNEVLQRRERWKYAALEVPLRGRRYEFEFKLGDYVYDLALLDKSILVEFDGPYHRSSSQVERDQAKDEAAEEHGFRVVRRQVRPATVIGADTIEGL